MNRIFALLITLLLTGRGMAEFRAPAGTYRIAEMDKAIDQAAKLKKPLVTVCGRLNPSEKDAEIQMDTLKAADSLGVPLLVVEKEVFQLPPLILGGTEGNGILPIIVISTPEGDKVWKVIKQDSPRDRAGMKENVAAGIKACKEEIKVWFAANPPNGPVLPGDKEVAWPLKDGATLMHGVYGKATAEGLYFKGTDEAGPPTYKMEDLTPATRRYLRYLAGSGAAAKPTAKPAAAAVEKWTNAQGKILQASFVALKDGKVTLRTAAGKEHVLAMDTLSKESQARARELAGEKAERK